MIGVVALTIDVRAELWSNITVQSVSTLNVLLAESQDIKLESWRAHCSADPEFLGGM